MYAFEYRRPTSLVEVSNVLMAAPDAKVLAGGQTLIPTMKSRLARPSVLVELSGLPELKKIATEPGHLTIGAMVTHSAVAESVQVRRTLPGLMQLADHIGDQHVRHRGTIGGSVANNDPAADYPAALLALNATVHTNKRAISADAFFTGLFSTALDETEVITSVRFPKPLRFAYAKFPNPASRYAMVGVAIARQSDGVRVAVTGAGQNGVFRVPEMEQALTSDLSVDAVKAISLDTAELNTDIHGSADYRAHLICVLAKRAIEAIK